MQRIFDTSHCTGCSSGTNEGAEAAEKSVSSFESTIFLNQIAHFLSLKEEFIFLYLKVEFTSCVIRKTGNF